MVSASQKRSTRSLRARRTLLSATLFAAALLGGAVVSAAASNEDAANAEDKDGADAVPVLAEANGPALDEQAAKRVSDAEDAATLSPEAEFEALQERAKGDLHELSDAELSKLVAKDAAALGPLSLGFPNNGQLLNAVRPKDSELFEIVAPDFCWSTQETLDYLHAAVQVVQDKHPETLPLHMGHISKEHGGYLSPHLSHQSGRDVDIGYYYKAKRTWYRRATNDTLDAERTWTLVKALITETDVEFIFIDHWVQILLKNEAKRQGEDEQWLHQVFTGSSDRPAIIRHASGHATHIHVRFFNPKAQENARLAYPHLLEAELIEPVVVYMHHRVRKGETLGRIAKRYGTTVKAIQRANGMRSTLIQAKKTYKIPRSGGPAPVKEPVVIPPRVLPPTEHG